MLRRARRQACRCLAGRHVAGQLVRCGTAAPPNYDEGCAAESKADFAHKLNVALKDSSNPADGFSLLLSQLLPENRIGVLLNECDQLCRILGKSVATVKGKNRQQRVDIADRDDN